MTRRRLSLPTQILLLSLANLLLLLIAGLGFLSLQLGSGVESLLLGPVSDKMFGITMRTAREIETLPREQWDERLTRLGERYGARAYLVTPRGLRVAGSHGRVPDLVVRRMEHDRPPRGSRRPPPPPGPPNLAKMRPPPPVFLVRAGAPPHYWTGGRLPAPGVEEGAVLLLESDTIFNSALFFNLGLVAATAGGAVLLSMLLWFPFVRGLTRSIRQMGSATERIAEGRFDAMLEVHRQDELGHLGVQINRMAARLSTLVTGQKRFLGDIAHELCAPLARMQMALGIIEEQQQQGVPLKPAALQDLREEVEELAELVNELLQFSRAALRPETVKLSAVPLAEVVRKAVGKEAGPGVAVNVDVPDGLQVLASELHVTRSLANLVRNSLRYAGPEGPIWISAAEPREGEVAIRVADAGPGVPEPELERIMDTFYRREESRTRQSGGAGLGLAIVKAGIEACHGTVVCRNRKPKGLEVTITLARAGR
ncbi:MAG: HAMP domain-containing histidine kinase [Bryobacterales bacterium]|nr:HAMP domain-containing histidine kinase [Bryobacterales bacterium]